MKTLIFASSWGSPLVQFSKFNNFLWVHWFLGKNLSNFVSPVWKLHNPYCHNISYTCQSYFIQFLLRLIYLNELILQGNQLRLLPPEFTQMEELIGNKGMLLMAENPWILPIQEQLNIGAHHLFEYLKSSTYKFIYDRNKWLEPLFYNHLVLHICTRVTPLEQLSIAEFSGE